LEFEVKDLLSKFGLPIPKRYDLGNLENTSIYPVVIKSQVPIGGRGKLGGIQFADDPWAAKRIYNELLHLRIGEFFPKSLLIEEKLQVAQEFYIGFIVNRSENKYNFIFSQAGGIDIEEISKGAREKIIIRDFIPFMQDLNELAESLVQNILGEERLKSQFKSLILGCLRFILAYDAELFEINPLIETPDHKLIVADARMNLDDNALFRHPEFQKNLEAYLTPLELEARKVGMSYVELEGDIGVICNGAGLVMATIDTIQYYGLKAANFLDVGGGADAGRMYQALKIISNNKKVRAILINIVGGITRCDEIAKGLIQFLTEESEIKFSLRLLGTNEQEAQSLLKVFNIKIYRQLKDAIRILQLNNRDS